jgi:hypothetical protein
LKSFSEASSDLPCKRHDSSLASSSKSNGLSNKRIKTGIGHDTFANGEHVEDNIAWEDEDEDGRSGMVIDNEDDDEIVFISETKAPRKSRFARKDEETQDPSSTDVLKFFRWENNRVK